MTRRLDARCPRCFLSGPKPVAVGFTTSLIQGNRPCCLNQVVYFDSFVNPELEAIILETAVGSQKSAQEYLPLFGRRSIPSGGVVRPFHTRSMGSPRALPDRCPSTQTCEVIFARALTVNPISADTNLAHHDHDAIL